MIVVMVVVVARMIMGALIVVVETVLLLDETIWHVLHGPCIKEIFVWSHNSNSPFNFEAWFAGRPTILVPIVQQQHLVNWSRAVGRSCAMIGRGRRFGVAGRGWGRRGGRGFGCWFVVMMVVSWQIINRSGAVNTHPRPPYSGLREMMMTMIMMEERSTKYNHNNLIN